MKVNASAARTFGATTLATVWSLASLVCRRSTLLTDSSADDSNANDDDMWSTHPCGGRLAQTLFDQYYWAGDVQMAAMLACVLWRDTPNRFIFFSGSTFRLTKKN